MNMKTTLLLGLFWVISFWLQAQVVVIAPQNGGNLCVENGYKILDTLKLRETFANDIALGTNQRLVLKAPNGFVFNTASTLFVSFSVGDIDAVSFVLSSDSLVLEFDVSDTISLDSWFLRGLEVRANAVQSSFISLGLSSDPFMKGISSSTNFGNLSSHPLPLTPSIVSTKRNFCSYDSKFLLASARNSPNEEYLWYKSNILISGQNDSILNLTSDGSYRVALRNKVTGCVGSKSTGANVVFYSEVVADAGKDKTSCLGSGVLIGSDTATSSGGLGFYRVEWSPSTGLNNAKSTNPVARPSQTTLYSVVVTDASGCVDTDSVWVNVLDTAKITFKNSVRTVFGLKSPAYNLESKLLSSVFPASGTFYFQGNGVAQNPRQNNQYFFFPSIAGVGNHRITYYHTLPNGCISKKDTIFEVQEGLVTGLDTVYCPNAAQDEITVDLSKLGLFDFKYLALFKDGIYYTDTSYLSRKNLKNYIFKPQVFFDSVGAGEFSVAVFVERFSQVFSFNDEAASSRLKNSHTQPNLIIKDNFCQNEPSVLIQFESSSYSLISASGIGVTKVGLNYRFFPTLVTIPALDSSRTSTISIEYSFDGCNFSRSYDILVKKTPDQLNLSDWVYCLSDSIKPIEATDVVAGGTALWYRADNDELLHSGSVFDPLQHGLDPTQIGSYDYYAIHQNSQGCFSERKNFSITINDTSVISINGQANFEVCESNDELFFDILLSDTVGSIEYFIDGVSVANLKGLTSRDLGAGTHIIAAQFTSSKGCKSYTQITGKVNPAPVAKFVNLPKEVCQNEPRFAIEIDSDLPIFTKFIFTQNPSSVLYEDPIDGNYYFDALDTGFHILEGFVYSGPDKGFCLSIFYDTIYVRAEPPVNFLGRDVFCANELSDTLAFLPSPNQGLSGVVSFSISGFTDLGGGKVLVNPAVLFAAMGGDSDNLPKATELVYSFTDNSGCKNIETKLITVLPSPKPTINIAGNKREFCFSDDSVLILGNSNLSGSGFFRGRGVRDLGQNRAVFSPSAASLEAGVGFESSDSTEHRVVYVFESTQACVDSAEVRLKVRPMPKADFSSRSTSFCIDDTAARLFPLFSKAVSSSVRFTGRGVITYNDGRTFFFPRIAAQSVADTITDTSPQSPTLHEISAEFRSLSGDCVDRITKIFTVYPLPIPQITGLKDQYCIDQAPDTLQGDPPTSGLNQGTFSGGSIINLAGGKGIFSPLAAGIGLHNITYTFRNENGCLNRISKTIRVIDKPQLTVTIPKTVFCYSDDSVELVGSSNQLPGAIEGHFVGRGIYNHAPNRAYFYPKRAALEAGVDSASSQSSFHTIVYQFVNALGCRYEQELMLTVHPLPDANYALENKPQTDTIEFCISDEPSRLIAINSKGLVLALIEFSGNGVSINSLGEHFFNPRAAAFQAGVTSDSIPQSPTYHPVSVRFVASNGGCSHSQVKVLKVNPLPRISVSGFKSEYCLSDLPDTLTGTGMGQFSSQTAALVSLSGGRALFVPQTSGVGNHTITYTLTNQDGCTSTQNYNIVVNALPSVSFSGFNVSRAYCYFADSVLLTGVPTDSRGNFKGNGISNLGDGRAWFKPFQAAQSIGRGPTDPSSEHRIVWTYTNLSGCVDSIVQSVRVDSLPQMGLSLANGQPIASSYCYSQPQLRLIGVPSPASGGTGVFSGRGITDNGDGTANFSPSSAQLVLGRGAQDPAENHTITYTFTDQRGCVNTISQTIRVDPLPTMSFVDPKEQYCYDQAPDTINSLPSGSLGRYFIASAAPGASLLPATRSNGLLDLGNGKAVFFPAEAAARAGSARPIDPPTSHRIVYRFTNPEGCDSTISRIIRVLPLPQPDIISSKRDYCLDDAIDTLSGRPLPVAGITSGSFSGLGITDLGDGRALFNPRVAKVSSPIRYNFVNADGCSNFTLVNLNVLPLPVSYFTAPSNLPVKSGQDWPDSVCFNEPPFRIVTDLTSPLRSLSYTIQTQNPDGTFRSGQGLSSDGFFLANLAGFGLHRISLNYVHQNGCDSTFSRLLRVSPEPKPDFLVLAQCEADSAVFLDISQVSAPAQIKSRRWDFGYSFEGVDVSLTISGNSDTVSHFFRRGAGEYNISLTIETNDGCINTIQKRVKIGATPVAAFEFVNQCQGNQTIFNSLSRVDFSNITAYQWDFEGQGFQTLGSQTAHTFSKAGRFNVKHRVISSEGCSDDTTIEVIIFPVVSSYPYYESFENNNGGWNQYGSRNSWEIGKPSGSTINSASDGLLAWVTNPVGFADSLERSFVESPCFDLRQLRRPMISLDVFSSNTLQSDGASLQYSTDNGITWKLLGNDSDLFGWYDRAATPLTASPGGSLFGWSGRYLVWKTARNYLDFLKQQNSVRFRLAYASTSPNRSDGFAFDNIFIGERQRTVLVEQFRNLRDLIFEENAANLVYQVVDRYHTNADTVFDAVAITYHIETSTLEGDSINQQNSQDPGARAFLYGISQAGRNVVNGDVENTPRNEFFPLAWGDKFMEKNALEDANFDLKLNFLTDQEGKLRARVYIKANRNFPFLEEVTLHVAAVEKFINVNYENRNMNLQWTMRKMIPNAGGTIFNKTWRKGELDSVDVVWQALGVVNPDTLGVVVFLQNTQSSSSQYRRIYQALYKEPKVSPKVITATSDDELGKISLYPNPANSMAYVIFDTKTVQDYQWNLFNLQGNLIKNGTVHQDSNGFVVDVRELPKGVYLIEIKGLTLKLLVE
jgi:PKD repeat protein